MTSYILGGATKPSGPNGEALKTALRKAFATHVVHIPADGAKVYVSINASVAVRLFALLYMRGVQHRLIPDANTLGACEDLLKVVCGIEIQEKFDDMFVSNFVMGLIVFLDLMEPDLPPDARSQLVNKISECRDWLSTARHRRVFGRRETEGTYAWNHSGCAAAALALSVIWTRDSPDEWTETDAHDVDFGLRRIEEYFIHGIRDTGVPYEGFYYCGAVFRVLGPFDILVQREPEVYSRYLRIRDRHKRKLGQLINWFESCTIVKQRALISFNHSPYDPAPAVNGFLSFFRKEFRIKAGRMWSRLMTQGEGFSFVEQSRDWADNTLHEALLFLHSDGFDAPRKQVNTLISRAEGYAVLVSDDFQSRLFVKASKLLIGPHNQSDAGHVSWVCDGQAVLIDAGPGQKVREASKAWAAYSKGTYRTEGSGASSYGHNAIIIDGRGQMPSGDGQGIEGRFQYALESERFWLLGTDSKAAYNKDDYNPVQSAERHIAFPKENGQYLVLLDRVVPQNPGPHTFKRLLHFAAPQDLAEVDGPHRMSITIGKTVYDLWTRSPTHVLTTDYVEARLQVPIRTRILLEHELEDESLWLCTVLAVAGTPTTPISVELIATDRGHDMLLCLSNGETWCFSLSEEESRLHVTQGSV